MPKTRRAGEFRRAGSQSVHAARRDSMNVRPRIFVGLTRSPGSDSVPGPGRLHAGRRTEKIAGQARMGIEGRSSSGGGLFHGLGPDLTNPTQGTQRGSLTLGNQSGSLAEVI